MTRSAQETRSRLVSAGRKAFSERGFERTTVREIADEAGVSPALINRYFGGKEQLFAEAVSIDLAFPNLSRIDRHLLGNTLVAHFFQRWEGSPEDDMLRVLIRAAVTNHKAAARMRSILADQVVTMVEEVAGPSRARERAYLIATQILGLAYARVVLGMSDEDIGADTIVKMVGKTIQCYLFADLP